MSLDLFKRWLPPSIAGYAREHTVSGRWSAKEALRRSREEHQTLLPQGPSTPGQHLCSIVRLSDRKPVGMLWFGIEKAPKPAAFVYNLEIFRGFRRRGYARQAMQLLEVETRRLGLDSIRLHVFGHNAAARALYDELGYVATNVMMKKRLARASSRARRGAHPSQLRDSQNE
jgi:ribosomal protein S18 acetylase RimI-like enzyme